MRNHARDQLGFQPRNDAEDHGRLRAHLRGKRRDLPSETRQRVQVVLRLMDSAQDVDADLRPKIIRQMRRISHLYEDDWPAA